MSGLSRNRLPAGLPRTWSCSSEIPLLAIDGTRLLEIGTLLPDEPFDAKRAEGGGWETTLAELPGLTMLEPLHLLDLDMRRCDKADKRESDETSGPYGPP